MWLGNRQSFEAHARRLASFVLDALEQARHDRRPYHAAGLCITALEAVRADSSGRRNGGCRLLELIGNIPLAEP
jgi:hypothetical protein